MRGGLATSAAAVSAIGDWVSRTDLADVETQLAPDSVGLHGPEHYARQGVPGCWRGSAAAELGLVGEVSPEAFKDVLVKGVYNGQSLRGGGVEKPAYILVLTMPKSVSLLEAGDPLVRKALDEAMELGVGEAISVIERYATVRRGAQGKKGNEPVKGVVAATYRHRTSSAGDPHSHIHVVMSATAPAVSDGKWLTLDSDLMFGTIQRVAEAAGRYRIAKELSSRLGIEVTAHGIAEIEADRELIREFSRAGAHVFEMAGLLDMVGTGGSAAEHLYAWRVHRKNRSTLAQEVEVAMDSALVRGDDAAKTIIDYWRNRGAPLIVPEENTPIYQHGKGLGSVGEQAVELSDIEVGNRVARRLFRVDRSMTWADLVAWAAEEVGIDRAFNIADQVCERPDVRCVIPEGKAKWTKKAQVVHLDTLAGEASLRTSAEIAASTTVSPTHSLDELIEAASQQGVALTSEQISCALTLLSGRALVSVTGVAGAGKTALLSPVAEIWRNEGSRIYVTSRNAERASETAASIGVDDWGSLASLKYSLEHNKGPIRGDIVVVDEAGLIDRKDWALLIDQLVDNGVRVVAVGDREQNQPIDRKMGWALVVEGCNNAGASQSLAESWRCKAWEQEASALREGDAKTVVDKAAKEGRIIAVLADKWIDTAATRGVDDPGLLRLCHTVVDAQDIARRVQSERLGRAVFDGEGCLCRGGQVVVSGDFIRTRQNDHDAGVLNGQRWRVVYADEDGITVEPPDGRDQRWLAASYCLDSVELAYCVTSDSAQGLTAQSTLVCLHGHEGRTRLYSQATRGQSAPQYLIELPPSAATLDDRARLDIAKHILTSIIERDDASHTAHERLAIAEANLRVRVPSTVPTSEGPSSLETTSTIEANEQEILTADQALARLGKKEQRAIRARADLTKQGRFTLENLADELGETLPRTMWYLYVGEARGRKLMHQVGEPASFDDLVRKANGFMRSGLNKEQASKMSVAVAAASWPDTYPATDERIIQLADKVAQRLTPKTREAKHGPAAQPEITIDPGPGFSTLS